MEKPRNDGHIPFGLKSGKMVTPQEVARGVACDCVCVACGGSLLAAQGSCNVWHFRHANAVECDHPGESAVHAMAKQLIIEGGGLDLPARVHTRDIEGRYDDILIWRHKIEHVTQTGGFTKLQDCAEELIIRGKNEDGYRRPDVIGFVDGKALAVEIHYTNPLNEDRERWYKENGISVIEISVSHIKTEDPYIIKQSLMDLLFSGESKEFRSKWITHVNDSKATDELDKIEDRYRKARLENDLIELQRVREDKARLENDLIELQRAREDKARQEKVLNEERLRDNHDYLDGAFVGEDPRNNFCAWGGVTPWEFDASLGYVPCERCQHRLHSFCAIRRLRRM